ncbi:caspase-8-like isoform X2 [Patiria miniata]|nr:caspase-8-like isoform X2 [Patiria miniata]XP_038048732.1 caspase-8-like isoform X2 [Patiria miniata]
MASLATDAIPADPMAFRHLLKKLDDGLGSEDCHKLNFISADLGIPKAKLERVRQATDIFDELEKQSLIAADDVSLLWELMELIHRKDLLSIIHVYCNKHFVKELHTGQIGKYRLLLLEIADNTSNADMNCFKQACKDLLGRQAVSKLQNIYQLFPLLEERGTLAPSNLDILCQLLNLAGNIQMVQNVHQFESQGNLPDIELVQLSSRLVSEWRKLGTYLGLGHHVLEAIDHDNRGTEDKAREMLFTWRHNLSHREDAYGILSKALKLCYRMDLAEAVNDMARKHKQSALAHPHQDQMVSQPVQYQPVQYQPAVWSSQPHLMKPSDFCTTNAPSIPTHTALPVSDHGIPDQVLRELAEKITVEWQKMGTFLNMEHTVLRRINQDCHRSEEKAYNMLMVWRSQLKPGTDAVHVLASVLKIVGRVDLSEVLKGIACPSGPMARQLQSLDQRLTSQPMNVDPPAHPTTQAQQPMSQADAVPENTPSSCSNVTEKMEEMSINQSQGGQETSPIQQTYPETIVGNVGQGHVIAQPSLPEYRMNRNPRGLCMIINNVQFEGSSLTSRPGSEKDTGKLDNLFNKLHFEVAVKEDLTAHAMLDWFKRVSQLNHSDYDCFACCILTHGALGQVFGTDGEPVEIQQILGLFTGVSCRSLVGKPKMFFIQACQGKTEQEGVQDIETDEPERHGLGVGMSKTKPNEADFLLSYATVPGYVSYRSKSEGSWYVNALVDQINKHHNTTDMLNILTVVNKTLCDQNAQRKGSIRKQVPAPSYTLEKALYLRSLVG